MTITKHLPQTFMAKVNYQLTIRAFGAEWVVTYEWGQFDRFGDISAKGETIEKAIDEMIYYFDNHPDFEPVRRAQKEWVGEEYATPLQDLLHPKLSDGNPRLFKRGRKSLTSFSLSILEKYGIIFL